MSMFAKAKTDKKEKPRSKDRKPDDRDRDRDKEKRREERKRAEEEEARRIKDAERKLREQQKAAAKGDGGGGGGGSGSGGGGGGSGGGGGDGGKASAAAAADDERRRAEREKRKRAEADLFGESADVELAALDAAKPAPSDGARAHADAYELFPPAVYEAYAKLQEYARDLNTAVSAPEVVLVGRRGDGKSALLNAVMGEQLNQVGFGATVRPLYFTLVNAIDADAPRITVKRDAELAEFDHDVQVAVRDLPGVIEERSRDVTDKPIFVLYEARDVLNMTIIDTPGLDEKNPKIDALVSALIKPTSRTVVAVEQAKEFADMKILEFVKKADPELSRTVFAFTKFNQFLQTFTNARGLNRFLSQAYPDVESFFVTLPTSRVACPTADDYRKRIYQAARRDMALLEQLQFDKRYEASFGVHGLRRTVFKGAWKKYQDAIPRVLKELRAHTAAADRELQASRAQLAELNTAKLRAIASNYVVEFLQTLERLIAGTSEANPGATGQTLKEEKADYGDEEWLDAQNRPIRFDPAEWKIPYWQCKLYGGQQFERLLSEFRAVVMHTDIANVSLDDVATSAGINKLNNIPNFGWAASDLAAQKTQDAFVPLIEQLAERAVYVMKRLATLADSIILNRAKKASGGAGAGGGGSGGGGGGGGGGATESYPYFLHHVKDLYYKYVDEAAKECKLKCLDEFYASRTIYWHLSEYSERRIPLDRGDQDDARKAVVEMAQELFTELRERIVKNVMLKWYNFFLVPLQTALWSSLQEKVTTLSDRSLEQLFHLQESTSRLELLARRHQERLEKLSKQDASFIDAASQFAHPITHAREADAAAAAAAATAAAAAAPAE